MRTKLLLTTVLTFILLATACAPQQGETPTLESSPQVPVTGATATETMNETPAMEEPTETAAPATTEPPAEMTPTESLSGDVTIMTSTQGTDTPYLVDGLGRSLYIYMKDSPGSDASMCMDNCTTNWIPLTSSDTPSAGENVDSSMIGSFSRDDGSTQVTYNGWPLYYFNQDTAPGDINGQGTGGAWFLIAPDGNPIQTR